MSVEEIIRMLDDPGNLERAFREAETIEFTEIDRSVINVKRRKYSIGMSDFEKIDCAHELKCFLSLYEKDNSREKRGTGNYKDDPVKKWCHLDHKKIKHSFNKLRWKEQKLKVIMIEDDSQAFSDKIPEILHVCYSRPGNQQKNLASVKGDSLEDCIYLESMDEMIKSWVDFMNFHFELNEDLSGIYDHFKKKKQKETHFIVHSVENYNAQLIGEYLKLWESLELESPLYLFLHLNEKVRPKVSLPDNCICLYDDEYEHVSLHDLGHFCDHYDYCYSYNPALVAGLSSMSFREAVEKLRFCQK